MDDPRQRLIVALDVSTAAAARKIVAAVGNSAHSYKVGMQLYTAAGPSIVRELVDTGHRVFLDLKYHDIPNTVAAAVREAAQTGRKHAHSARLWRRQNAASRRRCRARNRARPPGSGGDGVDQPRRCRTRQDWCRGGVQDQVLRLAALALSHGCQGVVASAQEAAALREELGRHFAIVTPGVRPAGSGHDDQMRVVTPAEAISAGASHIVVGRPITAASDPGAEARAILAQIG